MSENVNIEYESKKCASVFGGSQVEVIYLMSHTKFGRKNQYRVTCRIDGIESLDPHLNVDSIEWLGDMETESNDETLTSDGAKYLFEDNLGS